MNTRKCTWCGNTFELKRKDRFFCDVRCRSSHHKYKTFSDKARTIVETKYGGDQNLAWERDKEMHVLMAKAIHIQDTQGGQTAMEVKE